MLDINAYFENVEVKETKNTKFFSPKDFINTPISFKFMDCTDAIRCKYENGKMRPDDTGDAEAHKCNIIVNGVQYQWDIIHSKFDAIMHSCKVNGCHPLKDFALYIAEGPKNKGYLYTARKSIFDFDISDKIVDLPNSNSNPIEKSNDRMAKIAKSEMAKMREYANQSIKSSNHQMIAPEAPSQALQAHTPTQCINATTRPADGLKSGAITGLNIPSAPTTPNPIIQQKQNQNQEPKHVQVARMIWSEAGYDARPQMQKYTADLCFWLDKMLSPELLSMTGDPSDELGTAIRGYLAGMIAKVSLMDATGGDSSTIPSEVHSGISRLVMAQAA